MACLHVPPPPLPHTSILFEGGHSSFVDVVVDFPMARGDIFLRDVSGVLVDGTWAQGVQVASDYGRWYNVLRLKMLVRV